MLVMTLMLALCLTLAAPGYAAEQHTKIRLVKTEGSVTIQKSSGKSITFQENMRLYSGYKITTKAAGYAWLSLDDTKAVKLSERSSLEVRASADGKKLELMLISGELLFNVSEPLKDDESLTFCTPNTVNGIRGTNGIISVIGPFHSRIRLLTGRMESLVTDFVSGLTRETALVAGETADFYVYQNRTGGEPCEIVKSNTTPDDIPGFAMVEFSEDPSLTERIYEESGLDLRAVTPEKARERLAQDERQQAAQDDLTGGGEAGNEAKAPVWTGSASSGTGSTGSGDSGASSDVTYYTVKWLDEDGGTMGTVSVEPSVAAEGETVTVTVSPETDCRVFSVTAATESGKPVSLTAAEDCHTFVMPGENVKVTAVICGPDEYGVSLNAAGGGTVGFSSLTASAGERILITPFAEQGYHLDTLTAEANGEQFYEYDPQEELSFTMPEADVTVDAVFSADSYSVYTAAGGTGGQLLLNGGEVTDNGVSVEYLSAVTVSMALDSPYSEYVEDTLRIGYLDELSAWVDIPYEENTDEQGLWNGSWTFTMPCVSGGPVTVAAEFCRRCPITLTTSGMGADRNVMLFADEEGAQPLPEKDGVFLGVCGEGGFILVDCKLGQDEDIVVETCWIDSDTGISEYGSTEQTDNGFQFWIPENAKSYEIRVCVGARRLIGVGDDASDFVICSQEEGAVAGQTVYISVMTSALSDGGLQLSVMTEDGYAVTVSPVSDEPASGDWAAYRFIMPEANVTIELVKSPVNP